MKLTERISAKLVEAKKVDSFVWVSRVANTAKQNGASFKMTRSSSGVTYIPDDAKSEAELLDVFKSWMIKDGIVKGATANYTRFSIASGEDFLTDSSLKVLIKNTKEGQDLHDKNTKEKQASHDHDAWKDGVAFDRMSGKYRK